MHAPWMNCEFWWLLYLKFFTGFMTKCLSQGGSSPWAAVQMVGDITTTHTLLFEAVTGLSLWTFMFQDALPLLRPCCMGYSSFRKRSTDARISTIGGPNECLLICYMRSSRHHYDKNKYKFHHRCRWCVERVLIFLYSKFRVIFGIHQNLSMDGSAYGCCNSGKTFISWTWLKELA